MHSLRLPATMLILALLPSPADACSCGIIPKPSAERRLEFPAVFHGKAIADEADESRWIRRIRFELIKDYSVKPAGADTVTVWTSISSASCGIQVPIGTEALIFADTASYLSNKPKGALQTHLCAGNVWGSGLEQALRAMEEGVGVRSADRKAVVRRERAAVDCGQVIFAGAVKANGARTATAGRP